MRGKILFVTATNAEALIFSGLESRFPGLDFDILVTGVGTMATARVLTKYLLQNPLPVLAVNAGLAGSFRDDLPPGSVGLVGKDCLADFGIDDRGEFTPAASTVLMEGTDNPFDRNGWIGCDSIKREGISEHFHILTGITSDTVSGSHDRIAVLKKRFNPDIESMEGATFFYICALEKVPYVAIRAVSNMIEERNREKWDIPLAMRNMREKAEELLTLLLNTE